MKIKMLFNRVLPMITMMLGALVGLVIFNLHANSSSSQKDLDKDDVSSNHNIIWRIGYIDTENRLEDYIHSTSKNGCKCSYRPFEFDNQYFEMMDPADDSVAAVNKFRGVFPKASYLVYEAYPYCKVKDWATQETFEEKNRITKRETLIDTWAVCQRLGLIDSEGHYIK
jgi:hypothetical protein